MFKPELTKNLTDEGYQTYRAKQIYLWLVKGVNSFNQMKNIPKELRNYLSENYYIANTQIKRVFNSKDGTKKYLFKLNDGKFIESVLMKYNYGHTVCISTQVGCKMGCKFCATGMSGFERNLMASEMLSQIQAIQIDNNIRISNIVLMGMGACGIVDKMYDLAKENFQLTLSVSLHAPNDDIRNSLMPINKKFNIEELLKACRFYIEHTNRRISFEYAMISGVNDSMDCAQELAKKLYGMLCHVNLIPVNNIDFCGCNYKKSNIKHIEKFIEILSKYKINTTVRRALGADINASCGQLRKNIKKEGDSYANIC